jgi:hypothetical protein
MIKLDGFSNVVDLKQPKTSVAPSIKKWYLISKIINNKLEIFSLLFPHPFELLLWTLISRGVTHQFIFILLSVSHPQSGK